MSQVLGGKTIDAIDSSSVKKSFVSQLIANYFMRGFLAHGIVLVQNVLALLTSHYPRFWGTSKSKIYVYTTKEYIRAKRLYFVPFANMLVS